MDRRRFLQHAGCALCTPAADRLLFRVTDAAAAVAYENLDPAARLRLADMALDLALRAGASYADVRIGRTEHEFLRARDRRLEESTSNLTVGFGVRVLLDGSWGFAGSEQVEEAEIRRVVDLAVENAKAARLIQAVPIALENLPAYREDWRTPIRIDPFSISTDVKASKLLAINEAALTAGASYCTSLMRFVREEKLFASSRGSQIAQVRVRSAPYFQVTGIDRQSGRFASRASLAAPRGEGWEYIERHDFLAEAALAAQEVQQKLRAKPVAPHGVESTFLPRPQQRWMDLCHLPTIFDGRKFNGRGRKRDSNSSPDRLVSKPASAAVSKRGSASHGSAARRNTPLMPANRPSMPWGCLKTS